MYHTRRETYVQTCHFIGEQSDRRVNIYYISPITYVMTTTTSFKHGRFYKGPFIFHEVGGRGLVGFGGGGHKKMAIEGGHPKIRGVHEKFFH